MARKNRYAYRPRMKYRCYTEDETETLFDMETDSILNALQRLLSPEFKTNVVEVLLIRKNVELGAASRRLYQFETIEQWNAAVSSYHNTAVGERLMNSEGIGVFWDWAAEQIILGKPPKASKEEGLKYALQDRHKMHRRAQKVEAALAEEKLWRALERTDRKHMLQTQDENRHLKSLVALMGRFAAQGNTGAVYAVRHCRGEMQFFHGLMDAVMFVHREKRGWNNVLIYEGGSTYTIHNHYDHASWFEDRIADAGYFLVWNEDKPEPTHPTYPIWRSKAIVTELPKPVPTAAPLQTVTRSSRIANLPMSPRSVRDLIRR